MELERAAGRAAQRSRALTAAEAHLRSALALALGGDTTPVQEAVICRNDLAGVLLERRLALAARSDCAELDLAEVEALAEACLQSLQTLGYAADHSALRSAERNLGVVREYKAAAAAAAAAAPAAAPVAPAQAATPGASDAARLLGLAGAWRIDEAASQNTGALLRYFGAPWLLVQAVLASPTPPLHLTLSADCAALTITYPGLFPLVNSYSARGPSVHKTPFGGQQACTYALGLDDAGPEAGAPALVLDIPQAPALGLMRVTHALRSDGRQWVVIRMLLGGEEKLRITRVYDRTGPLPA